MTKNNNATKSPSLQIDGMYFKDEKGRVCILRGVNLAGSAKCPTRPDMPSHRRDGFFDHRNVSFVGRPFPIEEADEHFQRLRHWGFTFLRFLVTWEAIEHSGPGIYDIEYFEYVVQVLHKAKEYGFRCFIDPHQDAWSRFTGGSGAPGWTVDLVGFDMTLFNETAAAIVHNTYHDPENYPKMVWPTNWYRLGCCTMYTLFFAGNLVAPRCMVDRSSATMKIMSEEQYERYKNDNSLHGKFTNIQDYLQECYCLSIKALVQYLAEKAPELLDDVVVGFDTMNEPMGGFLSVPMSKENGMDHGVVLSPLQAMLLGQGIACEVKQWTTGIFGRKYKRPLVIDPKGVSCWKDGFRCPWEAHGAYDKSTKRALNEHFFTRHPSGESIHWVAEFWRPFVRRFANHIREVQPNAIMFLEPPVGHGPPKWAPHEGDPAERIVFAPHYYDVITLTNKTFNSWWRWDYLGLSIGLAAIKRNFALQLGGVKFGGIMAFGNIPQLMGEQGIPFDLNDKSSYQKGGSYKSQVKALDANLHALEANQFNFTLWNYCPVNSNKWGDLWNGEDLSIFSRDTNPSEADNCRSLRDVPSNLDIGGRAISGFVRPYPLKICGVPIHYSFDLPSKRKTFKFSFRSEQGCIERAIGNGTEIFVPKWHYGIPAQEFKSARCSKFFEVEVSDGTWSYDEHSQILHYFHGEKGSDSNTLHHEIKIILQ